MTHKLSSERLLMTQLCEHDRLDYYSLLENDEVIKFCFSALSRSEIKAAFESRLSPWDITSVHWFCLAIRELETNNFVGVTGFKKIDGLLEFGFLLLPQYHGLGYGTESLKIAMEYASTLGFNEFVANVTEGNIGSCKVLEKCGFKYVSSQESSVTIQGKKYSNLIYCKNNR